MTRTSPAGDGMTRATVRPTVAHEVSIKEHTMSTTTTTTTTTTEADLVTPEQHAALAVEAYRAAKGADKARVRRETEADAKEALMADEIDLAKALFGAVKIMVPDAKAEAEIDWAGLAVRRAATLYAALTDLIDGAALPADVPDEARAACVEALDRLRFLPTDDENLIFLGDVEGYDAPASRALATAKVGPKSGPQRAIVPQVEAVFEAEPVGTFLTFQEIANRAAEGDYRPSSGAIANRVKAGDVAGVEYVEGTADRGAGGRKVA